MRIQNDMVVYKCMIVHVNVAIETRNCCCKHNPVQSEAQACGTIPYQKVTRVLNDG